jgi:riboflavin synthase
LFTGIIETIGIITHLQNEGSNLHISVQSDFTSTLKIDQSVSHNGVCLTVVKIQNDIYTVTAIDETLQITNLCHLKIGDKINLERATTAEMRLDGHMVQGHVDQTAKCIDVEIKEGSWEYTFEFITTPKFLLVNKGSVTVDGVSLTVVSASENQFKVAIIPYTFEHTIFNQYKLESIVNIEFDIIGKYVQRYMEHYRPLI